MQSNPTPGFAPRPIPTDVKGKPQLLWTEAQVLTALSVSKSWWHARLSTGAAPPPIKLPSPEGGPANSNRWRVSLILAWIDAGMPHFDQWAKVLAGEAA